MKKSSLIDANYSYLSAMRNLAHEDFKNRNEPNYTISDNRSSLVSKMHQCCEWVVKLGGKYPAFERDLDLEKCYLLKRHFKLTTI